jgi:tRNA1(Val) A37 N6-methylase TrmN6
VLTSDDRLLGGRIRQFQPLEGFRSGIEPVLLAASVPAKAGETVLEAGTGCGSALLCLHARVPDIRSVGVEIDPDLAGLAARNAEANGFTGMTVIPSALGSVALGRTFDHAIANPPYHAAGGTASSVAARERAKRGSDDLIGIWVAWLADHLRDGGSLTLIVGSGMAPACLMAMSASRCPCTVIYPLWPVPGRAARLVMLRGMRGSHAPMRLPAGLVLHRPEGGYTPEAHAILHDGAALAF